MLILVFCYSLDFIVIDDDVIFNVSNTTIFVWWPFEWHVVLLDCIKCSQHTLMSKCESS